MSSVESRLGTPWNAPRLLWSSTAGITLMIAAAVLFCAGAAYAAPVPLVALPGDDDPEPSSFSGPRTGVLFIDNSNADSWLEVDRTLNTLFAGKGTAGSDHDGGGGAIDVRSRDVSGTGNSPAQSGDPGQDGD
ncbi:hypothetical protein SNS2_1332 [Streptomyces netropsis]|uniref:Uncharacterized protein n=1 Tax=Streptomyces syringium TaxID=76729 RepID=A0ABS4Y1Z5_9ACTN|nr:hypothetical protein [Streptomyces syringium]MBP2402754.1 hypothetical protein [Streptomyces syringium]SPE49641.1 hypothetical protein SNS2_1332 [Streptomyces netropsis]